jgi:uncharacterized protein YgiM (DUF1202 family)
VGLPFGPAQGTIRPSLYSPISLAEPGVNGEARTVADTWIHSGPGRAFRTTQMVRGGTAINVSNTVQNGFRYAVHQGHAGWIAEPFLVWDHPRAFVQTLWTTTRLNLRSEPSLSANVLLVLPMGVAVTGKDAWSNGFRLVSYGETLGWAATAYLS